MWLSRAILDTSHKMTYCDADTARKRTVAAVPESGSGGQADMPETLPNLRE